MCVCVGWEGDLSRGRCNITKVLNNTIHLPGMIGCAVTAGLHFVLPVSDGHGPTDDLCAALPAYRGGGLHDFATHSFFFFPTDIGPYELFLQWRGAEELAQKVLILWRLWGNRSQCIEWYMSHSSQIVIKLKVHLRASRLIHILQLCFTWIHLYYFLTIVWLNLKGLVWRI